MALKATIFKAELTVSDLDRAHYGTHTLRIARHPSETDERMMVRVLAFAMNADERLAFGRGLSSEAEADLCLTDLTGAIDLWVDVGLPDEREIRKASGRAARVAVYTYGTGAELWWKDNAAALARLPNLAVVNLPLEATRALAARAARTMKMQCTIQEGHVWLSDAGESIVIEPRILQQPASA
ncbi:MAG: YaeQ family protein [Betaproteobacteria bacterium]|nr:YaeQ family protein [Betaproteobacteria bacterium]